MIGGKLVYLALVIEEPRNYLPGKSLPDERALPSVGTGKRVGAILVDRTFLREGLILQRKTGRNPRRSEECGPHKKRYHVLSMSASPPDRFRTTPRRFDSI